MVSREIHTPIYCLHVNKFPVDGAVGVGSTVFSGVAVSENVKLLYDTLCKVSVWPPPQVGEFDGGQAAVNVSDPVMLPDLPLVNVPDVVAN